MDTLFDELFGGHKQSVNSKVKGNRNEATLAKCISDWTGEEFVRIPQSGGLRWKNAQNICGDLLCTNHEFYFPLIIETKHLKSYSCPPQLSNNSSIYSIWKQPLRDAERAEMIPSLFLRKNGMPAKTWHVVLSENNFEIQDIHIDIQFFGKDLFAYNSSDLFQIPYEEFINFIK